MCLLLFTGDDSSNEDQGEEGAGDEDGEKKKMKKENKVEGDNGAIGQLDTVSVEPAEDKGEVLSEKSDVEDEGEEGRAEVSGKEKEVKHEDFSFPDTTISLTHLQPSR